MKEEKPDNSLHARSPQNESLCDHIDFSLFDENPPMRSRGNGDNSRSLLSCDMITPDKYNESRYKVFENYDDNDVDMTAGCPKKEATTCYNTPSEMKFLDNCGLSEIQDMVLSDLLMPDILEIDLESMDFLQMIILAKSKKLAKENLNNAKVSDSRAVSNFTYDEIEEKTNKYRDSSPKTTDLGAVNPAPAKRSVCKCSKSKCMKLYCECFSAQKTCGPECSCIGCYNTPEHQDLKEIVIKDILEKNPIAFSKKFKKISKGDLRLHSRGCNCKRSGCLKKYCECFAEGLKCTNMCKCRGCKNCGTQLGASEIVEVHEVVKRRRKRKKPFVNVLIEKLEMVKALERAEFGFRSV